MKGVETIVLETHNFGKTVKFWQQLGYTLEFETDHGSGLLKNKCGRPRPVHRRAAEGARAARRAAPDQPRRDDAPGAPVEIVGDWHPSHWGTQLLELRDPDGRVHFLEHGTSD